jgi:nickel-type superoxide dismutase maturation protease
MEPSLRQGDHVLVWQWAYRWRPPAAGDVVVLRDPDDGRRILIKRVAVDSDENGVYVLGDNAVASRDSRTFGAVPPGSILGKALLKY